MTPQQKADRNIGCAVFAVAGVACFALGFGIVLGLLIWFAPAKRAAAPAPATESPVVAELQAEIAAREADLDALVNTLNSAIAERNEAVGLLRRLGQLREL
jgi:C4-dicarboxylate-specific signal transduction histidine kinase